MSKFAPTKRTGFRFLREETPRESDFLPYPLTPEGLADDRIPKCPSWALSFFESREAILEKWTLLADREDATSRYGTHVGEFELNELDGISNAASPTGHFSLHAYAVAPELSPRLVRSVPLKQSDSSNVVPIAAAGTRSSRPPAPITGTPGSST